MINEPQTSMCSAPAVAAAYRGNGNGVLVPDGHYVEVLDGRTGGVPYLVTSHGRVLSGLEWAVVEWGRLTAARKRQFELEAQIALLQEELARRAAKVAGRQQA